VVWTLRRRAENVIDRWDGRCYRRALALGSCPVEVSVEQSGPPETPRLHVAVAGERAEPGTRTAVTTALKRLLGLRVDFTEFERFAAHDDRLGPLGRRFRGIKPPRFPTVFECLVNAIGEYVLLRGLGRLNVFPGDDVGARNNLLRWLGLTGPSDYDGVRHAITPWSAYGRLIYFHLLLWRLAEAGYVS